MRKLKRMKNRKFIIISTLTVITAAVGWNFLYNSLYSLEGGWIGIWIKPIVAFLILGVMLSLVCLLIESKKKSCLIFFLVALSFFLVFSFNKYVILSLVILVGMLFLGRASIRDELKVRFKIRLSKTLQKGLSFILTGLIIVISVSYCFTPSAQEFEIRIPEGALKIVQEPLKGILSSEIPQKQLEELPQKTREIIQLKIEEFTRPYQKYIPLALGVSLFLFLRLVAIPLGWLIILFSWIIFMLLKAFGVIRIEKVQKEAETIKI